MAPSNSSVFRNSYEGLCFASKVNPKKVAIKFEDVAISYEDFVGQIDIAALRLIDMGLTAGKSFAAYSQNRPELLVCYYAAAKLGAVFVPLNPNLTTLEVEYAFRDCGAIFLLYDEAVADVARRAAPSNCLHSFSELREAPQCEPKAETAYADPDDDFLTIYTSGSTGAPKAIVLSHTAQVNAAMALSQMWGVGADDVTVVGLPLGYLYGLSTAAGVGLQTGGTVVILLRFHPREVLEALVAHRATVYHGVPTMYSMMLEYCEQRDLSFDLSGVRALICAGAPLPSEMRERFARRFSRALQDYYAMTECTPVFGVYASDRREVPERAIGRLAPFAKVLILRPDGSACEVDEEGEIFVRGAATLKRYLNSPDLTAAAMKDGFVRSGDLGHEDGQGFYYITGRLKDVIIRGGANISPTEVEKILAAHSGVQDVAVIGSPDRIFGEIPVAFVVRRMGSNVSADELIQHAEKMLSDFKVPRQYIFLSMFPLGKTGKVDKAELKRRVPVAVKNE